MTFQGFDRRAVELLRALPGMDAEAYAVQRDLVADGLVRPGGELIEELAARLVVAGAPAARSSVSPLHTDLRFAPPGSPRYKDHLLLTAWHGADKRTGVTLWIRVDAETVGFACGVAFTPEARDRWRRGVASDAGAQLVEALASLRQAHEAHCFELIGDLLKRPPTPWDDHHPRAELLRRTAFQVRFTQALPVELIDGRELVGWCGQRVDDLLPVYGWLVEQLATGRRLPSAPVVS